MIAGDEVTWTIIWERFGTIEGDRVFGPTRIVLEAFAVGPAQATPPQP